MKLKHPVIAIKIAVLVSVLALPSCTAISSFFAEKHPKTVHAKARNVVGAGEFVEDIALSRLSLNANKNDLESISGNLSEMKAYAAQKRAKPKKMTLAVIDYKMNTASAVQQVIAPVVNLKTDFPELQTVLDKLENTSSTLQNIHLVSASISPDKSLTFSDDPAQIEAALAAQQARILGQSNSLAAVDDVEKQLALMDFFKSHHDQDAAYLTLDNIKRALALAAQKKTIDEDKLKILSARLEAQESSLKVELPYKF